MIIRQTAVCSIVVIAAYYIGFHIPVSNKFAVESHELAQTMAFLVLGWTSVLHIFTVRSRKSVFRRSLSDNPMLPLSAAAMFVFLGLLAAIPGLNGALKMANMSVYHWLITLGLSLVPTIVAEYGKFWDNYKFKTAERNRVANRRIG